MQQEKFKNWTKIHFEVW